MHRIGGVEAYVSVYGWADAVNTGMLIAMMPNILCALEGI